MDVMSITFEDREKIEKFLFDAASIALRNGHQASTGRYGLTLNKIKGQFEAQYALCNVTSLPAFVPPEDENVPVGACLVALALIDRAPTQVYDALPAPFNPVSDKRILREIVAAAGAENPEDINYGLEFLEGVEIGWDTVLNKETEDGYIGDQASGFEAGKNLAEKLMALQIDSAPFVIPAPF